MKYIKTFESNKNKYNIGDYVFVDYGYEEYIIAKILDVGIDWDYLILLPCKSDDEIFESLIKRLATKIEIEIFNIKKDDMFLINHNGAEIIMTFKNLDQEDEKNEYIYYFEFNNNVYEIYLNNIIRKPNKMEIDSIKYNL